MKKTVTLMAVAAISAAAAGSAQAAASTFVSIEAAGNTRVCDATTAKPVLGGSGASTSGSPITVGTQFVKVAFSITCSANTHASVNNYASSAFAVGSTSTKGNQAFRGGSNAGGIALSAGCAAAGCTSTDSDTALSLAVSNGS
jgi:hypothetical protein